MTDYLKANPFISRNEYLWELSIPYIMISSYDTTHIEYLSEEQAEKNKEENSTGGFEDTIRGLGIPIIE